MAKYIPYMVTRMAAKICTEVRLGSAILRLRPVRKTMYKEILMMGMMIRNPKIARHSIMCAR